MKKTVLILYSDRYDASALALRDYLEEDGKYDIIALDEKAYDNFKWLKFYNELYKFTYRKFPTLNNVVVNLPTAEVKHNKDSDGNEVAFKPDGEFNQRFRKFDNIAMRFDADYVICTSQYTIRKAVIAKEKYHLQGKIFALLTDYALQDNFTNHFLDGYFVVTKRTKDALIKNGIDEKNIYIINMPLPTFAPIKRTQEEVRKQFDIRNDLPVVIVAGGKYGSKYIYDTIKSVGDIEGYNFLVILNGNTAIEKKFLRWSKKNNVSNNIYFVKSRGDLNKAYYIADSIISAPSTLYCYEAILRKIPLILMDSSNNVERKNSKYLVSGGFAYSGINRKRIDIALEKIKTEREIWAEVCERYFKDNGCEQFVKCLDLLDEGRDPNEEYLNYVEEVEENVEPEIVDEIPVKEEKKNKVKKKFFFKKK
ncbi:MAG: hypothetical protein HDT29_06185 [Clostridiales bacterium]|nr:hypothetical protein [Clostridiales bacterium]